MSDTVFTFNTRHPEYSAHQRDWERARDAYSGGFDYIRQALIRHVSEIPIEFEERLRRAYYFNYPRNIAQRITQYALAVDPVRTGADSALVEDWSRSGLRTNEVMRQVSTLLNVYGRAWLFVGSPSFDGPVDRERAERERLRPYCVALSPLSVLDWAYGPDRRLVWAKIEELHTYDWDPDVVRRTVHRVRLWTRDKWRLYDPLTGAITEGVNPTGVIPLVELIEPDGFGIEANHWFEDVVRISDAILNNESEAQMNVVKQMFGMLVVSEAFARGASKVPVRKNDEETGSFAAVVARSAALIESVEEKGISRYISPSGVETSTIRAENANLKQELFDVVGLAIQSRSKEAQTAESKAWDFQNVTQFLTNRADLLEQAELRAWAIMNLWDSAVPVPEVTYNRKFAVRDLERNIAGLLQLSNIPDAGIEFRKAALGVAVELLDAIGSIPDDRKQALLDEIENLQPAPVPEFGFSGVDNSTSDNSDDDQDENEGGNPDETR